MATCKQILLLAIACAIAIAGGPAAAAIAAHPVADATLAVSLELRDPCAAAPAMRIDVAGAVGAISLGCSEGPAPQVRACASLDPSAGQCLADATNAPAATFAVSGGGGAPYVVRHAGASVPARTDLATLTLSIVY
jgi:hypothetical protein